MLNKVHIGKRLSRLRLAAGYSQTRLAEILDVTPQAVSKWEHSITLPDLEPLLALSHLYGVSINAILEDRDLVFDLTGEKTGPDGITCFLPAAASAEPAMWVNAIKTGRWVQKNWAAAQRPHAIADSIGKKIAAQGGTVLEIGVGPGGGYMPYILKADPNATVIISDLSTTVVQEWKNQLDRTLDSPNLYYTVFNFCQMPFADGSIDVISDGGGIGNCEQGTREQALKEAFRVLKPGGMLVTSTGFVTRETLATLPAPAQKALLEKRPDIFYDLYQDTVLAGFIKIDSEIGGGWYTDDDESTIADLARSLGINLKFTSYVRYCYKD